MNKQDYIDGAESALLHTYNRFPLVIDHGDGVYLYDTDGKEYLDFAAGIAVQAFGYNNKEYNDALKAQIDKVMHTSNLYYNVPIMNAAKRVLKASQMNRVFFTNSGTEAIEGAIKAAKKYAYTRDGHAGHEIIAMNHSFHGRSIGALSVTGNKHYQEPFEPLSGIYTRFPFSSLISNRTGRGETKTGTKITKTIRFANTPDNFCYLCPRIGSGCMFPSSGLKGNRV